MKRLLDFVIYCAVAAAALTGIWLAVKYNLPIASKWTRLVLCSAFGFGVIIRRCRNWWRISKFWIALSAFVALHCILFGIIFYYVELRNATLILMFLAEGMAFGLFIQIAMGEPLPLRPNMGEPKGRGKHQRFERLR